MLKGLLNLISFLNFNNWNNTIKHNSHQEAVCTDEKLLKTLKNRFNYASSACSARILSTNPEALSPSAAISGGQLVAQGPLQTDLPLSAVSLSKVYKVMPLGPTSTPLATLAGAGAMLAQAPNKAALKVNAQVKLRAGF